MGTNTPRKTWQTPAVFVLGAENTEAYKVGGSKESANHQDTLYTHTGGSAFKTKLAGSVNTYKGYQS